MQFFYFVALIFGLCSFGCSKVSDSNEPSEEESIELRLSASAYSEPELKSVSYVSYTAIAMNVVYLNPKQTKLTLKPIATGLSSGASVKFVKCAMESGRAPTWEEIDEFELISTPGEYAVEKPFCVVVLSNQVEQAVGFEFKNLAVKKSIVPEKIKVYPMIMNVINPGTDGDETILTGKETSIDCLSIPIVNAISGFPQRVDNGKSLLSLRPAIARKIFVTNEAGETLPTYADQFCQTENTVPKEFPGQQSENRFQVAVKRPASGTKTFKFCYDSANSGNCDSIAVQRVE